MKKQNLPRKTFHFLYALLTIFLIFLFMANIYPQVEIKERIEINPDGQTNNYSRTGCSFGGCNYDICDSTEIDLRFTPESVEPGGTTIMKLWIGEYEYD